MSLLTMMTHTADVFVPTYQTSGYGDNTQKVWPAEPTWTGPAKLTLKVGTERSDLRDIAIGIWSIDLPPDAPVIEKCHVRVDGKRFEVKSVYPAKTRRGLHHYVCDLETYSGTTPGG